MQFKQLRLEYTAAEHVMVECASDGEVDALRWALYREDDRFSLTLQAGQEVELHSVKASFAFPFDKKDRLFLNGYQSWTDSREHAPGDTLHSLDAVPRSVVRKYAFDRYGDYTFVSYGKKRGQLHGFSYAYVRRGKEFTLFGSLAEESGFTVIRFDTAENTITLEKDCRGHHFTGEYTAFDLVILRGEEKEVFDRWFALMGIPAPRGKRIYGYTSWYDRYEDISEQSVSEDLAGFTSVERRPDVFQIDDGYEQAVGDWLLVDEEKFPSGMAAAAEKIRAAGMTPGLWLAPFAAEKESTLVKNHPDWLLRDDKGEPVVGGSNWSGFYALDIYNEEVRSYLREVFDTVIRRWGFTFVKLDFLYASCVIPRRDKTRAQVMYDGMRLLREVCGDAWILGCGVPLAPAFGLVDYCRIGCDVSLSWDDELYMRPMHRERVSTRNTVLNTVFRRELHGRAFLNDPDVFLLREKNTKLTRREKHLLATVNALFGGVLFTSDNVAEYSDESRKLYEELLTLSPSDFADAEVHDRHVTLRYIMGGKPKKLRIPL